MACSGALTRRERPRRQAGAWTVRGVVLLAVACGGVLAHAVRTGPGTGQQQQPAQRPRLSPLEKIAELVLPYGYPLQAHTVQTEDGFRLTLLRIPHGVAQPAHGAAGDKTAAAAAAAAAAAVAAAAAASAGRTSGSGGVGAAAGTAADGSAAAGGAAAARLRAGHTAIGASAASRRLRGHARDLGPGGVGHAAAAAAAAAPRPVVFLQHGLLDSAAGWLVNGPQESLAFILADAGYDVWLGNVRGNSLSRAHAVLDPSEAAFWAWSYDEMAQYDLPAMLSYALEVAGAPSLDYIGHSQGTTVALAALSSQPAVVSAVRRAVLLAPVAVAKHVSSVPLLALTAMGTDTMFTLLGVHEFLPSDELVATLEGGLCRLQPAMCVSFLAALCGYNSDNLDTGRIPTYLSYTPAGSSVQNMAVRSRAPNTMSYFDYGTDCDGAPGPGRCNQLVYGSLTAPLYNLTAITTPMAVFAGTQDRLAAPLDVEFLLESLSPGVVRRYDMLPTYEHLDFIWGIDAKYELYGSVMGFLQGELPEPQWGAAGGGARRRGGQR